MKKIWLPYPLYFLKPFAIGFAGFIILYSSEDWFTSSFAFLFLVYAGWIFSMRVMWFIKRAAKSRLGRSTEQRENIYAAHFPD